MLICSICQHLPCLLHAPLRETMPLALAVACANILQWMFAMAREMLSFSHTSLTQNQTQKEKLLKKYTLCGHSRTFQMPLHSRPKRSEIVSQFPADFTLLLGNCKYYQNVGTLTCGSGAFAGSGHRHSLGREQEIYK